MNYLELHANNSEESKPLFQLNIEEPIRLLLKNHQICLPNQ